MLKKVRSFFDSHGYREVDTPMLSRGVIVDAHIDLFEVDDGRFLLSSPEYGMKRLLAEGAGDIYQLSHVFRKGEEGAFHLPEFTMLEWYRCNIDFDGFTQEVFAVAELFLGPQKREIITYRKALLRYSGCDYTVATVEELIEASPQIALSPDDALSQLWGCVVEPELGREGLTLVTDFPADQAALAKTRIAYGIEVAERFELYYQGVELGNGYHELSDACEIKRRFEAANQQREIPLPLCDKFLEAMGRGLPDCYGIALGFDRLLALKLGASNLKEVSYFLDAN